MLSGDPYNTSWRKPWAPQMMETGPFWGRHTPVRGHPYIKPGFPRRLAIILMLNFVEIDWTQKSRNIVYSNEYFTYFWYKSMKKLKICLLCNLWMPLKRLIPMKMMSLGINASSSLHQKKILICFTFFDWFITYLYMKFWKKNGTKTTMLSKVRFEIDKIEKRFGLRHF